MIGMRAVPLCRFSARIAAQPSSIGIDKSITITSGREATAMRTPMAPLVATRTRRPWVLRYVEYSSRVAAWSSTTRTSGAVLRALAGVMFHEVYMRARRARLCDDGIRKSFPVSLAAVIAHDDGMSDQSTMCSSCRAPIKPTEPVGTTADRILHLRCWLKERLSRALG